mmetsp:Transcript_29255/g.74414  ORF Transcript_29255/g.74414 Transcript_29255/m.74414 type:complete len:283 (-) Transcript_29255:464-1312(-)
MQVQAVGHDLGLHHVPQRVVDGEGDDRHHDDVHEPGVRRERHQPHRSQDGEEGAYVRNEVQRERDEAEDEHQLDAHGVQREHHAARDDDAGDGLAEQVALHHALDPRARGVLVDAGQHRGQHEEEEEQGQRDAADDVQHLQGDVHHRAAILHEERPAEDFVGVDPELHEHLLDLVNLARPLVPLPAEVRERMRHAYDDSGDHAEEEQHTEHHGEDVPGALQPAHADLLQLLRLLAEVVGGRLHAPQLLVARPSGLARATPTRREVRRQHRRRDGAAAHAVVR